MSNVDKYTLPAYELLIQAEDAVVYLDIGNTDATMVTVIASTAQGDFEIFGEASFNDPEAIVIRQFAIWGGKMQGMLLRRLADLVMEAFDVDRIEIKDTYRVAGHRAGRPVKDHIWRRRGR